jgi:hypothetical protein
MIEDCDIPENPVEALLIVELRADGRPWVPNISTTVEWWMKKHGVETTILSTENETSIVFKKVKT